MFATTSPQDDYHLLAEPNDRTLCGLVVVPIVIDRPATTSSLHLTSAKPINGEICEECAAIESARPVFRKKLTDPFNVDC